MAEKSEDQAIQTCKKVFTAVPELILCDMESEELMHKPNSHTAKLAAWLDKAETVEQVTISLNRNTFTTRPISDVLLES